MSCLIRLLVKKTVAINFGFQILPISYLLASISYLRFLTYLSLSLSPVPPTSIYILNSLNKELDTRVGRIGPYEEQDYVSLTCVSIGGKYPLPFDSRISNDSTKSAELFISLSVANLLVWTIFVRMPSGEEVKKLL